MPPSSQKQKGFVPILLLIAVVAVGVVVGYVLLPKPGGIEYIKSQLTWPRPTPTPTPPPGCYYDEVICIQAPCPPVLVCPSPTPGARHEPNGSMETAGWKTYVNEAHEYSLKYPSDKFIRFVCDDNANILDVFILEERGGRAGDAVLGSCATDVQRPLDIYVTEEMPREPQSNECTVVTKQEVKVDGVDAKKYIYRPRPDYDNFDCLSNERIEVRVRHGDKVYFIISGSRSGKIEFEKELDQILSTFKFSFFQ